MENKRDSKSESLDLIRKLQFHVKTLSESREEDKKHIVELERELSNCCQEIDYLQDHLNTRNLDLRCLEEQVCYLQSRLDVMENLEEEVVRLREQMKIFDSERSLLIQEIEYKEDLITCSNSRVEKLEESISLMGLDYQCEIESTKLESIALEQNLLEIKRMLEKRTQENARMSELIQDLEHQIQDADKMIKSLDKENKDLKVLLEVSDMKAISFTGLAKEQSHDCLDVNGEQSSSRAEKAVSSYGNNMSPAISKLCTADSDLNNKIAKMSLQIDEYEVIVKQLKEELRNERSKAKEEAEDLTQEMAELRYQLTTMLEDECKRRASIEQISLLRITELEAQLSKESRRFVSPRDLVFRNQ